MRFYVDTISAETGTWIHHDSVELEPLSDRTDVKVALRGVNIYAPRGEDELEWENPNEAFIFASNGDPIVRLLSERKLT